MVGFYGLVLEFWNPGTLIPGTIGGVSLLLALIALSALPVHYGALALLILGLGLMVAEAFSPGIGILGLGGLVAFVIGSIFLFEGAEWDIEVAISWPVILGVSGTTAALDLRRRRSGHARLQTAAGDRRRRMIGMTGTVVEWQDGRGRVHVHGEDLGGPRGQAR
jgi:membrane-bound serine protease (ClpP class)